MEYNSYKREYADDYFNQTPESEKKRLELKERMKAKNPPKLEGAVSKSDAFSLFVTFVFRVLCLFLIVVAVLVLFEGFTTNGEKLKCTYNQVDDAISNKKDCNGEYAGWAVFFAIMRFLATTLTFLPTLYVITTASDETIGFEAPDEMEKWPPISNAYQLFGKCGVFFSMCFHLTFFSCLFLFVNQLPEENSPIPIPYFFYYCYTAIAGISIYIGLYVFYNKCCHTKCSIPEITIDKDSENVFNCIYNQKKLDHVKDLECCNLFLGLLFISHFLCLNFAIGYILVKMGDTAEVKRFLTVFRVVLISIASLKYPITFRHLWRNTESKEKFPVPKAVMALFEACFIGEMLVDLEVRLAISLITIAGTLIVVSFIYLVATEDLKKYYQDIGKFFKSVFTERVYINRILTTFTSIACALMFMNFFRNFGKSAGDSSSNSFVFQWCESLLNNKTYTDSLLALYPNEAMFVYISVITVSMNIEQTIFVVAISMIVVLGWRYEGDNIVYTNIIWYSTIYMTFCKMRTDSYNDMLLDGNDVGYMNLKPHESSGEISVQNNFCVFVFLWFLVTLSHMEEKTKNIVAGQKDAADSPLLENMIEQDEFGVENTANFVEEDEQHDPEAKEGNDDTVEDWYFCSHWMIRAVVLIAIFFVVTALKEPWMEVGMKDFAFTNSNTISPVPNTPIESTDPSKWTCSANSTTPSFDSFNNALWSFTQKCDDFQENNEALKKLFNYSPFIKFASKFPYMLPLFFAMLFLLYGDLVNTDRDFNTKIASLILFVLVMNFFYFISSFMSIYVYSQQLAYYFVDLLLFSGFYSFLLATVLMCVALLLYLVTLRTELAAPV